MNINILIKNKTYWAGEDENGYLWFKVFNEGTSEVDIKNLKWNKANNIAQV